MKKESPSGCMRSPFRPYQQTKEVLLQSNLNYQNRTSMRCVVIVGQEPCGRPVGRRDLPEGHGQERDLCNECSEQEVKQDLVTFYRSKRSDRTPCSRNRARAYFNPACPYEPVGRRVLRSGHRTIQCREAQGAASKSDPEPTIGGGLNRRVRSDRSSIGGGWEGGRARPNSRRGLRPAGHGRREG